MGMSNASINWTSVMYRYLNGTRTGHFNLTDADRLVTRLKQVAEGQGVAMESFNIFRDMRVYPSFTRFYWDWSGTLTDPDREDDPDAIIAQFEGYIDGDWMTLEGLGGDEGGYQLFAIKNNWNGPVAVFSPYIGYLGTENDAYIAKEVNAHE